jgi:hypothetical protein
MTMLSSVCAQESELEGTGSSGQRLCQLARYKLTGHIPLIMQTALDGALTINSTCGTLHMHFSVLEHMRVLMGPQSYDHILRMAIGQGVALHVQAAIRRIRRQSCMYRRTACMR